ncbi:50S ribosomal protein, partial [Schistosoma japonicum]
FVPDHLCLFDVPDSWNPKTSSEPTTVGTIEVTGTTIHRLTLILEKRTLSNQGAQTNRMQSPSITTIIEDQQRSLYIDLPELVDTLKPNLSESFKVFDPKEGDAYSVGALPVGTVISEFEIKPGQGAVFCRTAGSSATVFRCEKYVGSKLNEE